MDEESDAGYLLLIELIANVSGVRELWKKEQSEGGILNLSYPFIALVAKLLEANEFSPEDERRIIKIINESYATGLGPAEGINNFLGAGFIEALSAPHDNSKTQSILTQLRPELQESYRVIYQA